MVSTRTLRGGTRLGFDLVEGVTHTVEAMHETIARRPLPVADPPGEKTHAHGLIARAVYGAIRGTNGLLRDGAEQVFRLIPEGQPAAEPSPAELRTLGALNGVVGDHLEATGNALATPMTFLAEGEPLELNVEALRAALPAAGGHLVVLVHGLCLTEHSWAGDGEASLARALHEEAGATVLTLRYNTGRHISTNGRELAAMLDQLCQAWPVELEALSLIGHSMGGLVIRSACWYAQESGPARQTLRRVVCLGTPHHGSMVERAGHALDRTLLRLPYVAPLAFSRHRSAGIRDLHHGDLLDEDWQEHDPHAERPDRRRPVPLLPEVDYYFAAATLGGSTQHPVSRMFGDLLVRLDSAVGSHRDGEKALPVPESQCRIFLEKHHFDLLKDPRVHEQVVDWFRAPA